MKKAAQPGGTDLLALVQARGMADVPGEPGPAIVMLSRSKSKATSIGEG